MPNDSLLVIVEFHGGPLDGSIAEDVHSEPVPFIGPDRNEVNRFNARLAWLMTEFGTVGKTFPVFAEAKIERKTVYAPPGMMLHEYRIMDRLDGDKELLLKTQYVGFRPYEIKAQVPTSPPAS